MRMNEIVVSTTTKTRTMQGQNYRQAAFISQRIHPNSYAEQVHIETVIIDDNDKKSNNKNNVRDANGASTLASLLTIGDTLSWVMAKRKRHYEKFSEVARLLQIVSSNAVQAEKVLQKVFVITEREAAAKLNLTWSSITLQQKVIAKFTLLMIENSWKELTIFGYSRKTVDGF